MTSCTSINPTKANEIVTLIKCDCVHQGVGRCLSVAGREFWRTGISVLGVIGNMKGKEGWSSLLNYNSIVK